VARARVAAPGDALRRARIARLATADGRGRPHVVPICFAAAGDRLYSPLDEKPKRAAPMRLRRVRNIIENPHVALVIDDYREDWRRLWYVLVFGVARIVPPGAPHHAAALRALRRKYPQYRRMRLEERPVLAVAPQRVVIWPRAPLPRTRRPRASGRLSTSR
jgi:PPOX class probable F420-dependent enzyme